MAKPLSFKDMINVEPRPGEDELTNYRVQKSKRTYAGNEDVEPENEALTIQQRMKRGRMMKRLKSRIKIGRDKAKRRMANMDTLKQRARKSARKLVLKKLTKGKDKNDLPFARRQELEKRLDKPAVKKRIDMLAKRMVKDKRKQEIDRKKR
jgi:viroplasmin and RNaseH domain-containing protein